MDPDRFIRVAILENDFEAQLLESILQEREIPHRLRSFYDTAYDGLFQLQKGWGEIYAPASHSEDVAGVLADIRSQEPQIEHRED